jgi:Spy/CpxP family protein refolding chaperone
LTQRRFNDVIPEHRAFKPKENSMTRIHKILASAAGALTLVAAAAVMAAPDASAGCPGMGPGMGRMGMMHSGHGGPMWGGEPGAMAEQHLAQFKTQLKITAAQEPAWSAFAAKATEQVKAMQAQRAQVQQGADAKTAAPDRMDKHIDQMKQRLAGMEAMSASVKSLYAALTPEQRVIADQQLAHMGQRGMGHGHGMRG